MENNILAILLFMDDVLPLIFNFINIGSDYKSVLFTCNKWYQFAYSKDKCHQLCNHLLTLLTLFPNKPWNWGCLSRNPNITWEFVQNNPDIPWDWDYLSRNPNITWEIIQNNSDKPWNWGYLSRNPNITWEIIQNNSDKPWNWGFISRNPNITWEIVKNNPDKPWDWAGISNNLR